MIDEKSAPAAGATAGNTVSADGYVLAVTLYKIDGSTCVQINCDSGHAIVSTCVNFLAQALGKKAPYAVPFGTFGGPPKEPPPGVPGPLVN